MKAPGKKVGKALVELLELPRDIVFDLPRIMLSGNGQLIMENHKGIIEYGPGKIRINTRLGEVVVHGSGLTIVTILPEEITISGRISAVSFGDWGVGTWS
jgi:sporulation protein YqfC